MNILMYHSIAQGPGPLAIAPDTFRMQLDLLSEAGFRGVSLRDYISARTSPAEPNRQVVLTFDDGYDDFVDVAIPEMVSRGWNCTVFLSSGLIGAAGGWDPDGTGRRRKLIDWRDGERLASRGFEIGAHGVTHTDLTQLSAEDARREIAECKDAIEQRAGGTVVSFAAPYGRTTAVVRDTIARFYKCAVGTRMAVADADSDPYDLPRIEMWYFRSASRWRAYLNGSTGYFTIRQLLRRARASALSARSR